MTLQEKLDGFRASLESDQDLKTNLDNEALRVKNTGVEEHALKVGQHAPDFELADMAGNKVTLAQLYADGPLVPDFSVPSSQLGVMRVSAPYPVKAICSQGVISFPHLHPFSAC